MSSSGLYVMHQPESIEDRKTTMSRFGLIHIVIVNVAVANQPPSDISGKWRVLPSELEVWTSTITSGWERSTTPIPVWSASHTGCHRLHPVCTPLQHRELSSLCWIIASLYSKTRSHQWTGKSAASNVFPYCRVSRNNAFRKTKNHFNKQGSLKQQKRRPTRRRKNSDSSTDSSAPTPWQQSIFFYR
ncbi:hypothetical protein CCH79_00000194 [Gambusia affinis]|uniref:Uncharacterized protein n=1 Tax=Gambusia affinis TaxID=33528 RepID=A0A315VWY5_GAMAF|nr:hypothetical protein CCH79_00000194 [Gambusia affinis]